MNDFSGNLKLALPNKGALSEGAVNLLSKAGYRCKRSGRELVIQDPENKIDFVFLRPRDIALYVGSGIIDAGITGIDNLDPDNIGLKFIDKLPISSKVPYHSIIGNKYEAGIPGGTDGIVPYHSSHLDGAESELIVKSGHSVQKNPLAIQELRRILLLHLKTLPENKK